MGTATQLSQVGMVYNLFYSKFQRFILYTGWLGFNDPQSAWWKISLSIIISYDES